MRFNFKLSPQRVRFLRLAELNIAPSFWLNIRFFSHQTALPEGWVLHEKSGFHIIDIPSSKWSDAGNACQKLGGDPTMIRSAIENVFSV